MGKVDTTFSDENAKKSNPGLTGYEKPGASKATVFDSAPTKLEKNSTVNLDSILGRSRFDRK